MHQGNQVRWILCCSTWDPDTNRPGSHWSILHDQTALKKKHFCNVAQKKCTHVCSNLLLPFVSIIIKLNVNGTGHHIVHNEVIWHYKISGDNPLC